MKKYKKSESFWNFLEFTGKTGRKDVKFLSGSYLFCLLLLFITRKSIPEELFYVTFGLPFAFFGFAFIFWSIKRYYLYVYWRVSFKKFIVISVMSFITWSALMTYFVMYGKYLSETRDNNFYALIPIIFLLIISGFVAFQILWYGFFNMKRSKRNLWIYILGHIALAIIMYLIVEYNGIHLSTSDSFTEIYIGVIIIQILTYALFWAVVFIKLLPNILIDLFTRKKNT